ncbi:acyltransferase family protein [Bradyrhizobium erythrophlei]|jgi:peptidoglycan/LPS O-acetylase OafA/YrhL|uniref:Peptidoglycan/LPS O-acetylase OafA/YrhL, contains acyltransferase and SGNH-hydrolase domains n=1 Tax=Bradyrhizobium erythrophlei TaxID=1437360 RepID=A0A1M7UGT3_9BRAD|nr:acyltransferase [Bradyrhizobium erythrophlei]SHN82120.1 Peptidoglycan/LPS O-acetylase OafA/YrhL, contains acyltransferase and SGNH-hydrolase domains [Bradyrhizobium erythrophlei]
MRHALTPNASTQASPANKLVALEGLRFLSAFAILVFHYRHFFYVASEPVGLVQERLPLYGVLHVLYDSGRLGVWIFWCISGFIFFWKYRDAIAGRTIGGWQFFVLRFSRLYPLHFVTLLVVALLQAAYFNSHGCFFVYQSNDVWHFLAQLFLASEWNGKEDLNFNGPIWSISVEVLVYLWFFLMLRVTRSWWLNAVIVLVCLNAVLEGFGSQLLLCLAFFYIGGLAAIARRAVGTSRHHNAIETSAVLAAVVSPLAVVVALGDRLGALEFPLLLAYTPILLFCLSRDVAVPHWAQATIEAAGNMTYSSYLLHFPIQLSVMIGFAVAGRPVPVYSGALLAVYLLTTLLLSYVTFRYFEAPAQRFIRAAFRRDVPSRDVLTPASSA